MNCFGLRTPVRSLLLPSVLSLVVLAACRPDVDDPGLPADDRPNVTRSAPAQSVVVDTPGTRINLVYQFSDNGQLDSFSVVLRLPAYGTEQVIAEDSLMGTLVDTSFSFLVPEDTFDLLFPTDTVFQLGITELVFWAYVFDNQGQVDSTSFTFQVRVDEPDTCDFPDQYTYPRDSLFNGNETNSMFDLIARTYAFNTAAADIAEISESAGEFARRLYSPNTNGQEKLIVLNNSSFNYEELSWCTLDQQFRTRPAERVDTTRALVAGDIILLDMALPPDASRPNKQHYAAIRILNIVERPDDDDYIVFEYKRSEND